MQNILMKIKKKEKQTNTVKEINLEFYYRFPNETLFKHTYMYTGCSSP